MLPIRSLDGRHLLGCLAAVACSGLCHAPLNAQSADWAASWTERLGTLVVDVPSAAILVIGRPTDSVRVSIRVPEGDAGTLLPTPSVRGTSLRLVAPGNQTSVEITVHVPHRFDAELRGSNGGVIEVRDVWGSIVTENSNAGVRLSGLRGPVMAATSNASIIASFDRLPQRGPLSFVTSNDGIEVSLPADARLDVLLETDNGRVESDFALAATPGARPIPRRLETPTRASARIGGGGERLRARTDNGNIVLRRRGGQQ